MTKLNQPTAAPQVVDRAQFDEALMAQVAAEKEVTRNNDLVSASRPGWWIIAGAGACVLVLGAASTSRRAERSADRTARLFSSETAAAEPAMMSTS